MSIFMLSHVMPDRVKPGFDAEVTEKFLNGIYYISSKRQSVH